MMPSKCFKQSLLLWLGDYPFLFSIFFYILFSFFSIFWLSISILSRAQHNQIISILSITLITCVLVSVKLKFWRRFRLDSTFSARKEDSTGILQFLKSNHLLGIFKLCWWYFTALTTICCDSSNWCLNFSPSAVLLQAYCPGLVSFAEKYYFCVCIAVGNSMLSCNGRRCARSFCKFDLDEFDVQYKVFIFVCIRRI